jgi:hypothetical protein
MTHKKIIRRKMEGIINEDKDIPRIREYFTHLLLTGMREEGFVPVLDISPEFSTYYNEGHYMFLLTIQSVKIGKKKSKDWEGISNGRLLKRIQ